MSTDADLLLDYTGNASEEAFTLLVKRHIDLVYSAAMRQVRSPQLAEEVAQAVFVDLARQARSLPAETVLSAWLYQVTRRTAIDVVRRESRRRLREQIAAQMNSIDSSPDQWKAIEPLLEEAMHALDATDRTAVLLRFFQNKSLREIGSALGVSEDAAQKRVSRAVDRLRDIFTGRGVPVTSLGLASLIATHAVQSAPGGLSAAIASAVFHALKTFSPAATITPIFTLKKVAIVGVAALIGWSIYRMPAHQRASQTSAHILPAEATALRSGTSPTSNSPLVAAPDESDPDPLKLLQGVADARQRISSGTVEFLLTSKVFRPARIETNEVRLSLLFDGNKLRVEQLTREYSYTFSHKEEEQEEIRRRADSMSREAAVNAGLLKGFEARYVAACDGATFLHYRETDGRGDGTEIDDATGYTRRASYFFDPRNLGLSANPSYGDAPAAYLTGGPSASVILLGKEDVEGSAAWHVVAHHTSGSLSEYWIDAVRPARLVKYAGANRTVVSRYAGSQDPLPTEVEIIELAESNGLSFHRKFVRADAHYAPVDPASFTLAGLGMQLGTPVSDNRVMRQIGYWTGTGLSENLPKENKHSPEESPRLDDLLALIENAPPSREALEAATWIILNTPDGTAVEKAVDVIKAHHTRADSLASLCLELERLRHKSAKRLLAAILEDNPNSIIRGSACAALALILKDEADYGHNRKAKEEAIRYFERARIEFGRVKVRGWQLAESAKPELHELHYLSVGNPAPEIHASDLGGRPMRLSDFRGQVVVLVFWWPGYINAPEHLRVARKFAGDNFSMLGVYGDDNIQKAFADIEKYEIYWPSFRDQRNGPITKAWNVRSWPDLWVLDKSGIIRERNLRDPQLSKAIEKLLRE